MSTYKKFTDFNLNNHLNPDDFIVGYDKLGTAEQRTTVTNFLGYGLNAVGIYPSLPFGSLNIGLNSEGHSLANGSFAQGSDNVATGFSSSVMGVESNATGAYSQARGYQTLASGDGSNAQGANTIAEGSNSFALGNLTVANGDNAYASGYKSLVTGQNSFAHGKDNLVSTDFSSVLGTFNKTGYPIGITYVVDDNNPRFYSIVPFNQAYPGVDLHVGKRLLFCLPDGLTTCSAKISAMRVSMNEPFNVGYPAYVIDLTNALPSTEPEIDYGISMFAQTSVFQDQIFLNGQANHVEGVGNISNSTYGHTEGYFNSNVGAHNHVEGAYNYCASNSQYNHVEGTQQLVYSTANNNHVAGRQNRANHSYCYMWNCGDSVDTWGHALYSQRDNQYLVNATGGIYLTGGSYGVNLSTPLIMQDYGIFVYKGMVGLDNQSVYVDNINQDPIPDALPTGGNSGTVDLHNQYNIIDSNYGAAYSYLSAVRLPYKMGVNNLVGGSYLPGTKITVANFLNADPHAHVDLLVKAPNGTVILYNNGADTTTTNAILLKRGYIAEFIVKQDWYTYIGSYFLVSLQKMLSP